MDASQDFYQQMQAKIFYAVTNQTPSEILAGRSDAAKPDMGLRASAEERAKREYQRFDDQRKADRREAAARELEALKRTDRALPKTPRRPVKPN